MMSPKEQSAIVDLSLRVEELEQEAGHNSRVIGAIGRILQKKGITTKEEILLEQIFGERHEKEAEESQ